MSMPPDPFDPRVELRQLAGQLRDRPGDDHLAEAVAGELERLAGELPPPVARVPYASVEGEPIPAADTINIADLSDHITFRGLLPAELSGFGIVRFDFGQGRDGTVTPKAMVDLALDPRTLRDTGRIFSHTVTDLARKVEAR